ncbi:hypothetical protein VMCG_06914 [Cytospora schulzeri]|uniref:Uncharacterized protein n=1 Tax=Cytospora schulzeri TaxID=448051 RepID=A0A423W1X1_9PEZI|nr:hypothetical protein VMCG_06914 [Valsa malicola]
MDLPHLGDAPRRYPDFCLSISARLIRTLTDVLTSACSGREENLVISVGSGSGLLEAHMQSLWSSSPGCNLTIEGVEVRTAGQARPVNRYLSEEHYTTVRGTFEVSPRAREASALMFVYPREPVLIQRYLQAAREDEDSPLRTVVWLGPKADWDTFDECLQGVPGFGSVEIPGDCGVVEYEMMAVLTRLPLS